MSRGTIGFQGFGRRRALEFPDGQSAAVSPPGRARIRYNDATGQLEASLDGAAFVPLATGGAASALSYTAWVDERSGNDGTAIFGDINLPYATVQAAVNAAFASGNSEIAVVVLSGNYQEDVVLPATAVDTEFGLFGVSGASPVIRSLTVNAPTAGVFNRFTLSDLTLGNRVGGGQTVAPFRCVAGDGDIDIFSTDFRCYVSSPGIDLIRIENPLAAGFILLQINGGQALAETGATVCRGMFLENGVVLTHQFRMESFNASLIEVDGFGATFDVGSLYEQDPGTVGPLFSAAPTAIAFMNFQASSFQPILGSNPIHLDTSPLSVLTYNSCVIQNFVQSAGVTTNGVVQFNYTVWKGASRRPYSAVASSPPDAETHPRPLSARPPRRV